MKRLLRIVCSIAILMAVSVDPLGAAQSASSGTGINPAAFFAWKAKMVNDDVTATGISVAFGGHDQQPLISYDDNGDNGVIKFAIPALATPGNCGVGNAWFCMNVPQSAAAGYTSRMAVYNFQDSFKVSWAYRDFSFDNIRLLTMEYRNDLLRLGNSIDVNFVEPAVFNDGYFDWTVMGEPSLVFDEVGNPHLALVMGWGGWSRVMYAHRISGTPTTPCNFEADTHFQCDLIFEDNHPISDHVHLVLSASGAPRISFFSFADDSLRYAYPQASPGFHPNCGPGGNTWRCIIIETSSSDNNFYEGGNNPPVLDMAIGPASPHLIIKARNLALITYIRYAKFVGSGGNCGEDYAIFPGSPPTIELTYRWECSSYFWDNRAVQPYHSFSLQVDSLDYPVIGLSKPAGPYTEVGVIYPAARYGGTGGWKYNKVDGRDIDTGKGVALALGQDDVGLMGYAELEDYGPNLKLAYQTGYKACLPSIRK